MKDRIIRSISKYIELSSEEESLIETFWKVKTLEKGNYLLRNGETCRTDNFVVNGALKAFYINPDTGKEEILYLAIENWWATDIESFQNQKPSIYNIQAIENTTLLQISHGSFQKMLRQVPKLERFFRIILENYLGSLQKRIILNHTLSAEQRYLDFLNDYPDISKKVSNYLIASYLGVTAEFLSRMRKKIKET
ncbi:Crp/Fnr family transcriptional regulator [Allomuricauda sp. NBRC 101325]|uniref:Crp/Fnr family transcriptional regulator n=1 Tax=Allomuricauda sp. NBRC 101325 TaxID=1113758 RepID=UPI0024A5D56E|nr:Crp/Fnr family transcriptional regulator [Muricauda sp. NBRC 101325]GLU45351.1 cAMP-binding protein [Muricauda sp. NBRC 101325]